VLYAKKKKKNFSESKKPKTKKTVAKHQKNSKMISLTRDSSSILNKNTMLTTQKRFYTTETNIGYYKQNKSKTTLEQRRI